MAMQNTFNVLVDLKVVKSVPQPLVTQNDSVVFILEVMENGVPFDLTDTTTVSLAHTRKDKTVVVTQGTKAGNKATFALGTNETSVTGAVAAKAQFYDATGRVSTLSFTYQVGVDPTGSGYIPSASEATLIEVVLNDGPLIIQSAEEAAAYANEQGDYALEVAAKNETRFLNAVSTVALRDSTYPTPSHGDTVRVTGTSTSYRYVLGTGWVVTDVYNSTAIDEVNQQLADTADLANGFFQKILSTATKINLYGTSITEGVGSTEHTVPVDNPIIFDNGTDVYREGDYTSPNWANFFRNYINTHYPNIAFKNKGIGGISARYVNTGANKEALFDAVEDIAFVMYGMNDRSLGDFETNIRQILAYVHARSNHMIVMVEQPVLNDNPSLNVEMRTINDTIIKVCQENGYFYISHYVDMLAYCQNSKTELSTLVQSNGGSHPIDNGYMFMWTNIQKRLKFVDEQTQFFALAQEEDFALLPMNFAIHTAPITDYPLGISYCIMQSLANYGLPNNTGGLMETYHVYDSSLPYNYRQFYEYNTNKKYMQNLKADGTWGAWVSLNSPDVKTLSFTFPSIATLTANGQAINANTVVGVTFDTTKFAYVVSPKSVLDTNLFFSYSFSGTTLYVRLFNAGTAAITPGTLSFDLTILRK